MKKEIVLSKFDKIYKKIGALIYYRFPQWRTKMPDKMYLQCIWRENMGYELNLRCPQTFSEKLQWLKLYDRKPIYTKMVDKASAKEYAASIIGDEYIIPTLGVYNTFDEIDFDKLPDQFVLKATHDSGGVYICKDKTHLDLKKARSMTEGHFGINVYNMYKEWPYKGVKPRIIAEQYINNTNDGEDLADYKFFCFNGVPKYCQVIQSRTTKMTIDFFDREWQHQVFHEPRTYPFSEKEISMPVNYNKMLYLASKLSHGHSFLRVDLYEVDKTIYFGELTFFPTTGMGGFDPFEWDYKFGGMIELPIDK